MTIAKPSASKSASRKALLELQKIANAVKSGEMAVRADTSGLKGDWAEALNFVNSIMERTATTVAESNRARSALDRVTSSVMIADADGVIRYANASVLEMLRAAESDIRRDLPNFETSKVVGSDFDIFHNNPTHQRRLLAGLTSTHRAQIKVGGRTFSLVATPIFENGTRVSTAVEWVDRSAEVKAEREIALAVEAAGRGDFEQHLDVTGSSGFIKLLGERFNLLLANTGKSLGAISHGLSDIAKGNLSRPIEGEFSGTFAQLQSDVETVRANLTALIDDMDRVNSAARDGRLDFRADASRHGGDYRRIVEGVNASLDTAVEPLRVAAEQISQIAKGIIPKKIDRHYTGDFNIVSSVNTCIDLLNTLLDELNHMSAEHDKGDIDVVIATEKFENDFAKVVTGINTMVAGHIGVKKKAMACVAEFGRGNFEATLEKFPGKKAFINDTIEQVRANLKALVVDADMLATAATEGRLSVRADASRHHGDYRKIVQGVNDTLDSVVGPMTNIAQAIDALGRNDMSVQLKGEYRGDYLAVKTSFDDALTRINNTLFQIVDAVEQVGQSADQLSAASQNMATTAEEQASAVEEVTSSLTQTDSQVKANTENANAANQLVIGTSHAASQGQTKMEAMTESMNAINAASQNIGKIIKVIDEIAFQTNLLALNAAVEAARAGQHGRGFAVVAQEVRNLAGRSAKAARETADMIEDSVKRVSEGVNIAKETSEALSLIVTNVVKVKDLVAEIAVASTEQSRGISQINIAMGQVGRASQAGSQQSEELASSSNELANVASRMRGEVRRFKLRERQSSGLPANIPGMENLTAEMVAQLRAMLAAQDRSAAPASQSTSPARWSAKDTIPLDQDERGYGNF